MLNYYIKILFTDKYAFYVFKRFKYLVLGVYEKTIRVILDFQHHFEKEGDNYFDTIDEKSSTDENEDANLNNDNISSKSSKNSDNVHRITNYYNLFHDFLRTVKKSGLEVIYCYYNTYIVLNT